MVDAVGQRSEGARPELAADHRWPRRSRARSAAVRRSRRAASSAWIVGGTLTSARLAALAQEGDHLLEEERVALGPRGELVAHGVGRGVRGQQLADQRARVGGRQRPELEQGGVVRLAPPARAAARAAPGAPGRPASAARRRCARSRCSIRSSSAGSAQCRSSNTSTTGCSCASCREQVADRAGEVFARGGGLLEAGRLQHAVGDQLAPRLVRERRARAPARGSVSPASWRTISASAQKVMPSP